MTKHTQGSGHYCWYFRHCSNSATIAKILQTCAKYCWLGKILSKYARREGRSGWPQFTKWHNILCGTIWSQRPLFTVIIKKHKNKGTLTSKVVTTKLTFSWPQKNCGRQCLWPGTKSIQINSGYPGRWSAVSLLSWVWKDANYRRQKT